MKVEHVGEADEENTPEAGAHLRETLWKRAEAIEESLELIDEGESEFGLVLVPVSRACNVILRRREDANVEPQGLRSPSRSRATTSSAGCAASGLSSSSFILSSRMA